MLGRSSFVLAFLLSVLPSETRAQTGKVSLRAGRVTTAIKLDGHIVEADWFAADSIAGLTEVEPREGARPASHTVVRVLATEQNIYIGIVALNPPGVPITSYSKARDSDIDQEDYLGIVFDTFRDGRSGYVFAVNPNGARADGLVSRRGEDLNSDWDAIWDVRTARSDSGWSVEMMIPIKSVGFRPDLDEWGFNVERMVQATQEKSRWAAPSPDAEIMQTGRSFALTDLPRFGLGLGLSVRPAVVVGGSRPEPDSSFTGDFQPSLDLTQRLGGDLLASLTLNTDFAETEVDTRRTNLTRFPLFFPEKRSFFLEGSDIFEFGLGAGQDVLPFHSRRIGLYQGREVPLLGGVKLNGRVGQTNLGGLITYTDDVPDLVPKVAEGAFRIQQNVLEESSVGVIGTFGDPAGRAGAWTAGADFTYQTTRFHGDKNLLIGIWGLATGREDLTGDRTAIGGKFDYPNDLWDIAMTWRRVGASFDPSLGFVPRPGVYQLSMGGAWQPRPHRWGIRQMFHELRGSVTTDLDFDWESWRLSMTPLNWQLESGDQVEVEIEPQGERLTESFEVADDVVIPAGGYGFTRYGVSVETASKRKLSVEAGWSFGGFYTGTLHEVGGGLQWRPSASFALSAEAGYSAGELPEGAFTEAVFGSRLQLNVSTQLQVSSYWQYDDNSREVGTNTRLRWSASPYADVFLVYNHNIVDKETGAWTFVSNDLRLKVQYTFRY
jgi:hypothetical protein